MLRTCSGALARGRFILAALAGMALACSDERSGAGPGTADPLPPDPEVGADAPLDLSYLCGNRFLVTNALGNMINTQYIPFYEKEHVIFGQRVFLPAADYFALDAGIALAAAVVFFFVGRSFNRAHGGTPPAT